MDSSITSSLKPSKAWHFPKAGAVPSVFSFHPHGVPSESTKHVGEGKAICLPPPSSGPNAVATHYRKLAERKGKRLQCRRSLCQEAFFLLLFQVALGKAPGVYTQRSVYARWRLRDTWRSRGSAFLNSKRLCPLFSSSTLSDERCSNLSFESPNQNPKNRTLNTHRDTGGTRCVLWENTRKSSSFAKRLRQKWELERERERGGGGGRGHERRARKRTGWKVHIESKTQVCWLTFVLAIDVHENALTAQDTSVSRIHSHQLGSVLWEVTMYGHLPLTKLGFLPVPLWPIFLPKCSLGRAMLQLEFRWSKTDEKHQNSPKQRQEKQRFARRKHWNHMQVTDRPRPDARL